MQSFPDLLLCDSSIDRLVLDIDIEDEDDDCDFDIFMRLMNGEKIDITSSNIVFISECARQLDNREIANKVLELRLNERLNESNVIDVLCLKKAHGLDCDCEISFIAEHFHDFKIADFVKLGVCDFERVIRHDRLRLESEDYLFDVIDELRRCDESYFSLFECV